ncbi:hypothetical protein AAMO2058_000124400 [Amorphochlora amoebiformis]
MRRWLAAVTLVCARSAYSPHRLFRLFPAHTPQRLAIRRSRGGLGRFYSEIKGRKEAGNGGRVGEAPEWMRLRGVQWGRVGVGDANGAYVIDLRAPVEYAQDHHPKAVNVPLLDDDERSLVGTIYKQRSPDEAFEKGLEFVEKRVYDLMQGICNATGRNMDRDVKSVFGDVARNVRSLEITSPNHKPKEGDVILYCARGGQRSQSVAALLQSLGWEDVWVMQGGYKSFRRHVRESFEISPEIAESSEPHESRLLPGNIFVLSGMTGVGKTRILHKVEELRKGSTLDLEGLAGHRSSLLGHVGLAPTSQKAFETGIYHRVETGFPHGYAVVESESRKVGDSIIPEKVWRELELGERIDLTAPLEVRVTRLCEEYLRDDVHRRELEKALPSLERVMKGKDKGLFVGMLKRGEERALAALLIEQWYITVHTHTITVVHYRTYTHNNSGTLPYIHTQ